MIPRIAHLSRLGDATTTLLLVLLNNSNLLKSLEDLAVNRARCIDVVARADSTVLGGTVRLAQTATLSELELLVFDKLWLLRISAVACDINPGMAKYTYTPTVFLR